MTTPLQELHVVCNKVAMETVTYQMVCRCAFYSRIKANLVHFKKKKKKVSAGNKLHFLTPNFPKGVKRFYKVRRTQSMFIENSQSASCNLGRLLNCARWLAFRTDLPRPHWGKAANSATRSFHRSTNDVRSCWSRTSTAVMCYRSY